MAERALVVLNPNASHSMTAAIKSALVPFEDAGFRVQCVRSPDGPEVISSQEDIDRSVAPMLALARDHAGTASGFVVGCFSDPGLSLLRDKAAVPVVGMQEASVSVALSLGARFGIIAMAEASVERQRRNLAQKGVTDRWAGSRVLGVGPESYGDHGQTLAAMIEAGRLLIHEDGADVVILGCAGMAEYRAELEDALGVPVVEPAQAAVTLLIGRTLVTEAAGE